MRMPSERKFREIRNHLGGAIRRDDSEFHVSTQGLRDFQVDQVRSMEWFAERID